MNDTLIDKITKTIILTAATVQKELGRGLLESTYEACLSFELNNRRIKTEKQKILPALYRNRELDFSHPITLLVENKVIVALNAIKKLKPVHEARLLSYLKISGRNVGLLINFNARFLAESVKKIVVTNEPVAMAFLEWCNENRYNYEQF